MIVLDSHVDRGVDVLPSTGADTTTFFMPWLGLKYASNLASVVNAPLHSTITLTPIAAHSTCDGDACEEKVMMLPSSIAMCDEACAVLPVSVLSPTDALCVHRP